MNLYRVYQRPIKIKAYQHSHLTHGYSFFALFTNFPNSNTPNSETTAFTSSFSTSSKLGFNTFTCSGCSNQTSFGSRPSISIFSVTFHPTAHTYNGT